MEELKLGRNIDAPQSAETRLPLKCDDRATLLAGCTTVRRESAIASNKEHRMNTGMQERITAADAFCKKVTIIHREVPADCLSGIVSDLRAPETALSAAMRLSGVLTNRLRSEAGHLADVQRVIELEALPVLASLLHDFGRPEHVREVLRIVLNISHGDHSTAHRMALIRANFVPQLLSGLIAGLDHSSMNSALLALNNLAKDSPPFRDLLLQCGTVDCVAIALQDASPTTMQYGVQLLSSLCSGVPRPLWNLTSRALPTLVRSLHQTETSTLYAACLGLAALTNNATAAEIQEIGEAGPIGRLVELLDAPQVTSAALFVLCNICTVHGWVQACVNRSLLQQIRSLGFTSARDLTTRLLALKTLQYVTSTSSGDIQAVIDADLVSSVLENLLDLEFQTEVIPVITNVFLIGTLPQAMLFLLHPADILTTLWKLLSSPSPNSNSDSAHLARQALSSLASRSGWSGLIIDHQDVQTIFARLHALPSLLQAQPSAQP